MNKIKLDHKVSSDLIYLKIQENETIKATKIHF